MTQRFAISSALLPTHILRLAFAGSAFLLCCEGSISAGDEYAEKVAAAKIEALDGKASKDPNGEHVTAVIFFEKNKTRDQLTDADLEAIDFASFSELASVHIIASDITDRSLAHLGKIPAQLKDLLLYQTKISDKGLAGFLRKQKSFYGLTFRDTPITSESLREIGKLKGLRMLTISGTKIGDKALPELAKRNELAFLNLSATGIKDAGLADIAKLTNLFSLDVSDNKITDAGIEHLASLTKLRKLNVGWTKVTKNGAEALQNRLPNLEIVR